MKKSLMKTFMAISAVAMLMACSESSSSDDNALVDPNGATVDVNQGGEQQPNPQGGDQGDPNSGANQGGEQQPNPQGGDQNTDPNSGANQGGEQQPNPQGGDQNTDPNSGANQGGEQQVNPQGGDQGDPNAPASSASEGDQGAETPVSSASKISEFRDIADYGEPPAEYTKDISNNGKKGWNSRYWDACKPHCAWISNGQEGKTDTTSEESYQKGMTTTRNCNIHDVEVPTYTLGHAVQQYWFGYEGTNNACDGAGSKGTFACTDMAPIAVNENLSYAYVAGPGSSTTCGKCFHLQYDGSFKDASGNNAPKETHQALKGKHIIVMTSNIGHDVQDGQFDLMVPGGGVGAFDALSTQVNGAGINWGAGFGGFLTECQSKNGYDNKKEVYQQCVRDMCDAAFGNAGLPNLLRGCHWFADWYMAADNPTYNWEEVECPQYLLDHYLTRFNTTKDNNWRWHDDWSTYKEGDVLDTVQCWKDGENPNDPNGKAGCNP
ncbi:MAG: glycosyl hydrolase family 5 [Fibrobacter sp.]|nr:glycosyl hydrolase family 5 [Fibrobacter sp.]